jgi:adenylate cyclase
VSFEAHLARETVESERLRSAVLAAIFAVLMVAFPLVAWIFHDDYRRYFSSYATLGWATGVTGALVAYELLVRYLLGRMLERGAAPPAALRFWNALIETSVPTLLMVLVARELDPHIVLQGPPVFLYAVFIVLSTLRLDFALSAFTGLVAAAGFVGLSYGYAVGTTAMVLLKALVLILSGLAAGFVAAQLRRRIRRVFRTLQTFGQQVSPEIAAELLRRGADLAGRRSFVCVMFMDIRGFTPLAEQRSPEEIVALQNEVFGTAIEVVHRHRGVINQFLGDGFMATFGAPLSTGEDCRNAVAAARELVARITRVRIGVGLHAGDAVTGNVGTELRRQYSVTGNVVILASRIEQLNKRFDSQLLLSQEVLERCGDQAHGAVPLGPVQVKGRADAIQLYRVA